MRKLIVAIVWLVGIPSAWHSFGWTGWTPLLWGSFAAFGVLLLGHLWRKRRRGFVPQTRGLQGSPVRTVATHVLQVALVVGLTQVGMSVQHAFSPAVPSASPDVGGLEHELDLLERGKHFDAAVQLLQSKLDGDGIGRRDLAERLYRNLLLAGKSHIAGSEQCARFSAALQVGGQFGLDTQAAELLLDKCRRRERFTEQLAELQQEKKWAATVSLCDAALIDEGLAGDRLTFAEALRDAWIEQAGEAKWNERKTFLDKAQAICRGNGVSEVRLQLEYMRLEREVAEKTGPLALPRGCKVELETVSAVYCGTIIDLWVWKASGEPVEDLGEKDLKVYWNGEVVPAITISSTVGSSYPRETFSYLIAMDVSGSMKGPALDAAKAGAKRLLQAFDSQKDSGPSAYVKIISFSDDVLVVSDWSWDYAAASKAVDALEAKGETALYKAVAVCGDELASCSGRKQALLFTDGKDTVGGLDASAATLSAKKANAPFSVIGLQTDALDGAFLKDVAKATEGDYREAANPDHALEKFNEARRRVGMQRYRIVFCHDTGRGPAPGVVMIGGKNGVAVSIPAKAE